MKTLLIVIVALAGCATHVPDPSSCGQALPLPSIEGPLWETLDGRSFVRRDPGDLYSWDEATALGCEGTVTCEHFPFLPRRDFEGQCENPTLSISRNVDGATAIVHCDAGTVQLENPCGCDEPMAPYGNVAVLCPDGSTFLVSDLAGM